MPSTPVVDAEPADTALPSGLIDQIASGFGDDAAMGHLADAQLLITLNLLSRVRERAVGRHAFATDGWVMLERLDGEALAAVGEVLAHPYVRAWAMRCLQPGDDCRDHVGYVNSLAAAAALRADRAVDLRVPIVGDRVHLPTVGTVYLPGANASVAELWSVGRGFTLRVGATLVTVDGLDAPAGESWQPARRIECDGLSLLIEDGDPYRDCHQWAPSGRASSTDGARWQEHVAAAWRLIRGDAADYVPGLLAGLRTVAPLAADPGGLMRASTSRDAFGSVASVLAEPAALAVILVHEFQHGKLGALLDLCQLLDPSSTEMFMVPWRTDPRPHEGVLQGTYAHVAVADMWRRRADQSGPQQMTARKHYRQYRDWSEVGLDVLLRHPDVLTVSGRRFVQVMAAGVAGWAA
ncbi:hypothetical protein GCM10009661_38120 [Catellatospora chokoriensis]|uniref:HEXXH motif-containing protein n=1 Tax=Catellatospora chokoriensis TaxID=310353 RepID=A0A8J3K0R2_9ACTN|nr:hypothetical protein Cch02nite_42850 [Catellatospora chokoriensis]